MGIPFRAGAPPKITRIPEILTMDTRLSEKSPRASKITENHTSDIPKSKNHLRTACFLHFCDQYFLTTGLETIGTHNCQNANKKRNGTVAGYARSALDQNTSRYINIWECPINWKIDP